MVTSAICGAVPTSRLSGSFIRTRIRLRSSYSPAFHEHPAQHVAHLRTSCALPRTVCAFEWTPQRRPLRSASRRAGSLPQLCLELLEPVDNHDQLVGGASSTPRTIQRPYPPMRLCVVFCISSFDGVWRSRASPTCRHIASGSRSYAQRLYWDPAYSHSLRIPGP